MMMRFNGIILFLFSQIVGKKICQIASCPLTENFKLSKKNLCDLAENSRGPKKLSNSMIM